jgi:hypothetical protein
MVSPDEQREALLRRIYDINEKAFAGVALDVWKYQYDWNPLYQSYCNLLGKSKVAVQDISDIPFMPIVFFREHIVKTGVWKEQRIFRSSGTTGSLPSRHFVRDRTWYHSIAENCFSVQFGKPKEFTWVGLLPSYLEREDSSLVDMVHYFMQTSNQQEDYFFPQVNDDVIQLLNALRARKNKVILMGVSFGLLDLFENYNVPVWDDLLVLETGGMKGRGLEITRDELYGRIKSNHPELRIGSEYGMTELMSQAYLVDQAFQAGPTMRVSIRDVSDPFILVSSGQRGAINVIDLANIDTCAFIATDDIGYAYPDGRFEVLGRLDNSDLRGCNLLYV